jgi:hypothetical protein
MSRYRGRVGDEGDDAHRSATVGAPEQEYFVDAGELQRPGMASGAAVGRFVSRCGRVGRAVARALQSPSARPRR